MSLLQDYGKPLGSTPAEAADFLATELERAVPTGWVVRRLGGDLVAFEIERQPQQGDYIQNYGVFLPRSLDYVVFTHSNKDFGPLALHHVLRESMVIDASSLRHFGVPAVLQRLMESHPPNELGLT